MRDAVTSPREVVGRTLLERDAELEAIAALVERAAAGKGALAVIGGPAGAGKTSLVRAAERSAEAHGFLTLSAQAGELEAAVPYGVARGLFEPPLRDLPAGERSAVLQGAAGLAAPVLSVELTGGSVPLPAPTDAAFAGVHGLYWLSANLTQRAPLLLSVDDVHWADAASLRFLTYLARRVEELAILIVVASRPPEPDTEGDLLEALADSATARKISPGPLSEPATGQLLLEALGAEPAAEFARGFHELTGGNPFLVTSTIATLREEGMKPTAESAAELGGVGDEEVRRSVLARLRRLPPAAVALAEAVAMFGPHAEARHVARLAELDDGEAAGAADALARQEILRAGHPLEFLHPLVRAAVYEALPAAGRALAHRRAARLLDAEGASAELIAPHLLATEPAADPWVVERLRSAARGAVGRGAPEAAVSHLRRALLEPPAGGARAEVLRELGGVEYLVGDQASVEHLREALESASSAKTRGELARELTHALLPLGRFGEGVAALEAAIDGLGERDRELALELEAELASAGRLDPSSQPPTAARLEGLGGRATGRTPAERLVLASLAFQRALSGATAGEVTELAERSLDGGLLAEQGPDSPALADVYVTLIMAEHYERAQRTLDDAIDDGRARSSLIGFAVPSAFRALLTHRRGNLAEAEEDARAAMKAASEAGWIALELMSRAWLVEVLLSRGEVDAARGLLTPWADVEIPDNLMRNFLLHARALTKLAAGELETGLADLAELRRREDALGWCNPARFAHRSEAAVALARLGQGEEARRLAAKELELARAWGTPRAIGAAQRALGLVEGPPSGLEQLRDAVATLEGADAELERARALVDLGAALRRAKRRRDCREPLRLGMDLAHHCGAAALRELAAEELRATGARPRRAAMSGVDSLTASERRVARMAAEGMSNREIAQALFVTLRTVEVHLTHAYQKLDISSRGELPEVLDTG